MNVAWRNLLQDRTRLTMSIAGVALAVMLILLLNGFLSGMYRQISAYLENTPGSVVVAQEDVNSRWKLYEHWANMPANGANPVDATTEVKNA